MREQTFRTGFDALAGWHDTKLERQRRGLPVELN